MRRFFKDIVDTFIMTMNDCSGEVKLKSQVPKHEIDAFVRTFYPAVVAFFQTEEGRREYEEWKAKREAEKKKTVGENPAA